MAAARSAGRAARGGQPPLRGAGWYVPEKKLSTAEFLFNLSCLLDLVFSTSGGLAALGLQGFMVRGFTVNPLFR